MTSLPTVVIMLYKIYIANALLTDKWTLVLAGYRSCSFGLYFCVYLLLCASLRLLHLKISSI